MRIWDIETGGLQRTIKVSACLLPFSLPPSLPPSLLAVVLPPFPQWESPPPIVWKKRCVGYSPHMLSAAPKS